MYKEVFNQLEGNQCAGFIMAQEWVCHLLNSLTNHYLSLSLCNWMGKTLAEVTGVFAIVSA